MKTWQPRLSRPEHPPLDRMLAGVCLASGTLLAIAMWTLDLTSQLGLALTPVAAALVYLLGREALAGRGVRTRTVDASFAVVSPRAHYAAVPETLLSLVATLAIAGVSAGAGARPAWVFLVLAAWPGLILARRLVAPEASESLVPVLFLAVAATVSATVVYPYDGGDTWTHLHNAGLIAEHGSLGAIADAYRDYPLYPATLAALSWLSGLSAAVVARLLGVAFVVAATLIIYATARLFRSPVESVALALLLVGSKWFIAWGSSPVAMQVSTLLFIAVVAVVLRRLARGSGVADVVTLIGIVAILPFFHPVVAVASALLLLSAGLIGRVFARSGAVGDARPFIRVAGLAAVVILSQWMWFGDFVFDRSARGLTPALFGNGAIASGLGESRRSISVTLFDDLNIYILLLLALVGLLRALRTRLDPASVVAGVAGLGFVAFGYAAQLAGFTTIAPDRWALFGSLLLVFPAGSGFAAAFLSRGAMGGALGVALVCLVAFTGVANNQTNPGRPLYGESVSARPDLTGAELAGAAFIGDVAAKRDTPVRTDSWLWNRWRYLTSENENDGENWRWDQVDLERYRGVFAGRPLYREHQRAGYSDVRGFAEQLRAVEGTVSRVFDSGGVQVYERVPEWALER